MVKFRQEGMKNFRSNYYEKVGFKAVDVKKALESVLNEAVIDKEKLSQFTLKYDVPSQYRNAVWKILLDVTSCNRQAAKFVWEQRVEQYELLLHGLLTMRKIEAEAVQNPDCRTLALMFALEENKLHLQSVRTSQRAQWEICFECSYQIISNQLTDDPVEIYWLCRNMTHLLTSKRSFVPNLMHETESRLRQKEPNLHEHLQKLGFWKSSAVHNIFETALGNVLEQEVAVRIWDKFIAGSVVVQIFVAIECFLNLEAYFMSIKQLQVAEYESIERKIREISVTNQLNFVERALDFWTQIGCPTTFKSLEEESHRRLSFSSRKISKFVANVK